MNILIGSTEGSVKKGMELIEEGRKIHSYFFKRLGRYWD
jgi:hypothetical protein